MNAPRSMKLDAFTHLLMKNEYGLTNMDSNISAIFGVGVLIAVTEKFDGAFILLN